MRDENVCGVFVVEINNVGNVYLFVYGFCLIQIRTLNYCQLQINPLQNIHERIMVDFYLKLGINNFTEHDK